MNPTTTMEVRNASYIKRIGFLFNFFALRIRTGLSFTGIKIVCWLFQVSLVANYVKELNMVQLEVIPKSIERMRQKDNPIPSDIPSQDKIDKIFGAGDPIN